MWARVNHLHHFTGGIDVCQRNEQIKGQLYKLLMNRNSRLHDISRILMKSDCLTPPDG